jgi:hypothetical protein
MKELKDIKIGEIIDEDLLNGIMEKPNKLVKIGYTFKDKNGTQMEMAFKHKDFEEDEELEQEEKLVGET